MNPDDVGVSFALEALLGYLEANVPAELDRLDALLGRPIAAPTVDGVADPWRHPALYARTDRAVLEPDDYPAILGVAQDVPSVEVIDEDDGGRRLLIGYRIRLFAFTRAFTYDDAGAARNRLAAAVTRVLAAGLGLATAGRARLRPTWTESFSEVGVDTADGRSYSGWYADVIVDSLEDLSREALGAADTIAVAVDPFEE